MKQVAGRSYDMTDVRVLMNDTGDWAQDWDDLLHYLETADGDAAPGTKRVPQLIEDVRQLKQERVRFTTDYRAVWRELSAVDGAAGDSSGAAAQRTPSRVLDVLNRVNSKEYRQLAESLGAVRAREGGERH